MGGKGERKPKEEVFKADEVVKCFRKLNRMHLKEVFSFDKKEATKREWSDIKNELKNEWEVRK